MYSTSGFFYLFQVISAFHFSCYTDPDDRADKAQCLSFQLLPAVAGVRLPVMSVWLVLLDTSSVCWPAVVWRFHTTAAFLFQLLNWCRLLPAFQIPARHVSRAIPGAIPNPSWVSPRTDLSHCRRLNPSSLGSKHAATWIQSWILPASDTLSFFWTQRILAVRLWLRPLSLRLSGKLGQIRHRKWRRVPLLSPTILPIDMRCWPSVPTSWLHREWDWKFTHLQTPPPHAHTHTHPCPNLHVPLHVQKAYRKLQSGWRR